VTNSILKGYFIFFSIKDLNPSLSCELNKDGFPIYGNQYLPIIDFMDRASCC